MSGAESNVHRKQTEHVNIRIAIPIFISTSTHKAKVKSVRDVIHIRYVCMEGEVHKKR